MLESALAPDQAELGEADSMRRFAPKGVAPLRRQKSRALGGCARPAPAAPAMRSQSPPRRSHGPCAEKPSRAAAEADEDLGAIQLHSNRRSLARLLASRGLRPSLALLISLDKAKEHQSASAFAQRE
jgi:hypothetical protein